MNEWVVLDNEPHEKIISLLWWASLFVLCQPNTNIEGVKLLVIGCTKVEISIYPCSHSVVFLIKIKIKNLQIEHA